MYLEAKVIKGWALKARKSADGWISYVEEKRRMKPGHKSTSRRSTIFKAKHLNEREPNYAKLEQQKEKRQGGTLHKIRGDVRVATLFSCSKERRKEADKNANQKTNQRNPAQLITHNWGGFRRKRRNEISRPTSGRLCLSCPIFTIQEEEDKRWRKRKWITQHWL